MARGLKSLGMEELGRLKRRVNRQYSLERITKPDKDFIVQRIDEIEARIVSMSEKEGGSSVSQFQDYLP